MFADFGDASVLISTRNPESYGISITDGNYSSALTVQKVWSFTGSTRIYVNSPTGTWTYTKTPSTQTNILGSDEYDGHPYAYGFLDIYITTQNAGAVSNRTATFTFYDANGNQFGTLSFQHMNNKWTPTPDRD